MSEDERRPDHPLHQLAPAGRAALLETLAGVLEAEAHPAFAYVFGSFIEDRPFHDIDVGIHFGGLSSDEAERKAEAVASRLAPLVPFPLDIVALDARAVTFKFHVYRGQLLFARNVDLLTFELEHTMRVYFDIEPVLRQATSEAFSS